MSITRIVQLGFHVTVLEWERAVVLRDGAVSRTVDAGRHRRRCREQWYVLDVRPRRTVVPPQEVLTADGLQVRASLFISSQISDPARWLSSSLDVDGELHALAQLRLREAVAGVTLDELVAGRQQLLDSALAPTAEAAAALGVTVTALEVRDLTLPQELRHAFASTAMAREEGKAQLERARGEAAALRSLANTAGLLEKHPELVRLRAIAAVESGGQLILRMGDADGSAAGATGPADEKA